jgi:hypothetical protein
MTSRADRKDFWQPELGRLDLLLNREILRLRLAHRLSNTELRGLYVSDGQVDALIRRKEETHDQTIPEVEALTVEAERLRSENLSTTANHSLQRVAAIFELEGFERDVLLLAAAPELELRYEVLYSYLNDDVTRKRPTCDLAIRLFCDGAEERWERRRHFALEAPLFRYGLLEWLLENPDVPASSLARSFKVPLSVVDYLLEAPSRESKLLPFTEKVSPGQPWDDLPLPAEFLNALRGVRQLMDEAHPPVLVFEGSEGAGRQACAEALFAETGSGLIVVDVEAMMASQIELPEIFRLLGREQRLCNAGIYFRGVEAFFDAERRVHPRARSLPKCLVLCQAPVILACALPCDLKLLLKGLRFHLVRFPPLPVSLRRQVWHREIEATFGARDRPDVDEVASQFVLTAGQIRDAVQSARDEMRVREGAETLPTTSHLFAAARAQSQRDLHSLAQRIEPVHRWDNLVLPVVTMSQLREIVGAVRHRHIVYAQWGFEQRLSLGKGLKALFAGPSGTGKTMTAEVLSRELGLDLYKIDLSTVVSKYIGETEKNLDRIFRAAQSSNAILFFDEADALFGKRSEVKDAHDRYANIEVAYLLQKIEEYDGFVILATNFILNIDEAFKRRMNYTIEFPFPDQQHREMLWRAMFPPETPLGEDLDFPFLARQFALSGGHIKNAALSAAFLAAADSRIVRMPHLIQAVAREWQKLGKLPSAADFKQYYALLLRPAPMETLASTTLPKASVSSR